MGRKRKNTAIRLVLFAFVFFVVGITFHYIRSPLKQDLELGSSIKSSVEQSLQQAEYGIVDLNELTSFEWDTLYIIKPFPMVKQFCKKHNIKYRPIKYTHTDDTCLLLFVSGKKIVAYVEYNRGYGDFAQPDIKEKYSAKDVSFKFYREESSNIYADHYEKASSNE